MRKHAKIKKPILEGYFKFNVLNNKNEWEAWTGSFKTEEKAMIWLKVHGKFHLDNGHVLGYFKMGQLVKIFDKNNQTKT